MTIRSACKSLRCALRCVFGVLVLSASLTVVSGVGVPTAARADLKLCNMTASRVGVAIGRKEDGEWIAEGWWNILSNACETLFRGELKARFYYVHALDYDRGGEWAGKAFMCTDNKVFTIRGVSDCQARGYRRKGFFEVDTKNAADWTVRLSDPREDNSDGISAEPTSGN